MRARPHHHPCSHCQARTECCGDIEQNYDGWPDWVCREYDQLRGRVYYRNSDFLCDACAEKQAQGVCEDCGAWGDEAHDARCTYFQGIPV